MLVRRGLAGDRAWRSAITGRGALWNAGASCGNAGTAVREDCGDNPTSYPIHSAGKFPSFPAGREASGFTMR